MRTVRRGLVALLAIVVFALPAVEAGQKVPVGVPTVVDSAGQTVGTLVLPQNPFFVPTSGPTNMSLVIVTVGATRVATLANTDGFCQHADLFYQSYDCVGDPLLYTTNTEFLPFLYVWGSTGYYGGKENANWIDGWSVRDDGVCRNLSIRWSGLVSPASTVDLSGFTPPFSAK